jgi:hypothetical protein
MGMAEGSYLPSYIEPVRIVNVNIESWSVDAVGSIANKRFFDIQVMSPYFHYANGEGIYVVPEVGAYAWVCFPSTGRMATPFILGFQAPFDNGNINYRCHRQNLNPGDIMLRTRDENFVVLRRGGVLQIGATPTCQTMYVPIRNIIRNFCENFELNAFGGDLIWSIDRPDKTPTGDEPALFKLRAKEKANDPGHIAELSIGSHGADSKVTLELIVRESGLEDAKDVCTLQITKEGNVIWGTQKDLTLTVNQNFSITVGKDVAMNYGGLFTATAKKDVSIKSSGGEATFDGANKATVKSASQVVIDAPQTCLGGASAIEPIIKGQQWITFMSNLIMAISRIASTAPVGPTTAMAEMAPFPAQLASLVSSKVFTA